MYMTNLSQLVFIFSVFIHVAAHVSIWFSLAVLVFELKASCSLDRLSMTYCTSSALCCVIFDSLANFSSGMTLVTGVSYQQSAHLVLFQV
jgi:hypothetical protein